MINKQGQKIGPKRGSRRRFPYEPRVVGGKLLMPAVLQAIHRYVTETPVLEGRHGTAFHQSFENCPSSSARPISAPGTIRIAPDYTSAAADGVVPSALILVDVRHRPMRCSDRIAANCRETSAMPSLMACTSWRMSL
jgi:hypothetical protein